jgi:DHA1 family tetracycline resistance protein-like MFS transporter
LKRAPLFVLLLTVFIDLLGFGIVVPLLAFFAKQYGATGRMVGVVLGVYSLMQFFFSPVWGRLSDRIGRRPVLIISLCGSVVGYALFGFAGSIATLLLARIVSGIAAANIGTAQAYVADSTTPENRAKGMGLIGAAFGMGFIFGPPLGGFLARLGTGYGMSENFLPGIVSSGLSLIALSVAVFALPESKPPDLKPRSGLPAHLDRRNWSFIFTHRSLALIFGSIFLIIFAFAGMEPLVTLHATDRFGFRPVDLGKIFGFMGVVVAVLQGGVIGRLTRLFGERTVIVIGAVSLLSGLLLVPVITRQPLLYAAAMLVAIGQGLCYPSLTSLVTRESPPDQIGSMLGISSSLGSLSRVLGPVFAGYLYDRYSAMGGFWGCAAVVAVALVLAVMLRKRGAAAAVRGVVGSR